jgi:Zonular occludens toxin (Zot)
MSTRSATRLRRQSAIRVLVGGNGSGKTLLATGDLLPSLRTGRPVMSPVRILDGDAPPGTPCTNSLCDVEDHGQEGHVPSHPLWIPLRHLSQLLDESTRSMDLFLDEAGALLSSRESSAMPFQVATLLQQLRKRDLTATLTAPSFKRIDLIVREVAQIVTLCHGYGSRDMGPDRLWRGRRLIRAVTYNAQDLEEFEASKATNPQAQNKPRKIAKEWVRVINAPGLNFYDTFGEVPPLGFASLSGTCVQCGGRRAAPKCSCPSDGLADLSVMRRVEEDTHQHLPIG